MSGRGKKKNNRKGLLILIAFIVAAGAAGGIAFISGSGIGRSAKVQVASSPVRTDDLKETLKAYRGKVVLLDFWATWCGPCRSEIPGLVALQRKYRDQGLEIVGVSLDHFTPGRGGAAAVGPFMKNFGINYNVLLVEDETALGGYDVSQGIPTKYILNREGRVIKSYVGARPSSVVEKDIKQLL